MVESVSGIRLLTLEPSKPDESDLSRCLSPSNLLRVANSSIDSEFGEMEDYDEIAGGPLCLEGSNGYSSPEGVSQSWFDIRVMYVRVTGCGLEEAPESLAMRFPSRSLGVALKVNGVWISPSEEASVSLRRDRVDTETVEATYVSTDSLRVSGTISYEVSNKDEVLVSGSVELSESGSNGDKVWGMECRCVVGKSGCGFLKNRPDFSSASVMAPPALEVSIVGRHLEIPVFLTQTVPLIARRKLMRVSTLDAIPETEELGKSPNGRVPIVSPPLIRARDSCSDLDKMKSFMDLGDDRAGGLGYGLDGSAYGMEGEDGEMSWFNAGVRVGVGIGLGMCLGAGIGIGLMVRTYQATTRTLRRMI